MNVIFVGGRFNGVECDIEEMKQHSNGRLSKDWSLERSLGRCVPRAELDNQPQFDGYLGPMWDGCCLRYETPEVYNMLSN